MGLFFDEPKKRKTLSPAKRIYIWEHHQPTMCAICGKRITSLSDIELDHKRAYSKGGTSLQLAHKSCNRIKSSGALSKLRKQGLISDPKGDMKKFLKKLSMNQLKYIAKKHFVKVSGRKEEGWFSDSYTPASKTKYISAITKEVSNIDQLKKELSHMK